MEFWLFVALLQLSCSLVAGMILQGSRREVLKREILELGRKTQRGLSETQEERSKMLSLFTQLEALNSEKKTIASKKLNGTWVLEYTTSESILGKNNKSGLFQGGKKKVGKILQIIGSHMFFLLHR